MDQGKSSMSHVWLRPMSGNRRVIVRCDFDNVVTKRYDRNEMAAAIAAFPCTTACSP